MWRFVGGYGGVILLIVILLFPFLWLLQMSLKPEKEIFAFPPRLLFTPTFEHYLGIWSGQFHRAFGNSTVVSLVSTVLSLVFGVPAAYSLSRAQFGGESQIALWVLATRMAPPIAFTIPFFLAYRHLGWLDTLHGLILIYLTFNLSLVIWMMRTFFESIPRVLDEAALVDGAGVWGTFFQVVLPLSAPGLAATLLFRGFSYWLPMAPGILLARRETRTLWPASPSPSAAL
jgi:multiple sugar transport system permease protein